VGFVVLGGKKVCAYFVVVVFFLACQARDVQHRMQQDLEIGFAG